MIATNAPRLLYLKYNGRGAVALSFVTGRRDPQDGGTANSPHAFFFYNNLSFGGRGKDKINYL
jgi:hypothetical protein